MSIVKINLLSRSAKFLSEDSDQNLSNGEERVGTMGAKLDSDLLLFIPACLSIR